MAIELLCPECGTEYWGPSSGAKCGGCDYYFDTEDKINYRDLTAYLHVAPQSFNDYKNKNIKKRKENKMQKFLTAEEVKMAVEPKVRVMFTVKELVTIKVSMQFIQEKFYYLNQDKDTKTYKQLITIRDKCIDALEK